MRKQRPSLPIKPHPVCGKLHLCGARRAVWIPRCLGVEDKTSAVGCGRSGESQTFSRLLAFFRGQDRSHRGPGCTATGIRLNAQFWWERPAVRLNAELWWERSLPRRGLHGLGLRGRKTAPSVAVVPASRRPSAACSPFFRGQDRSHTGQAEPLAAVRLNAELLVGAVLTAKKAARKSAVEDKTSAFGGPTTPAPALYFINNFHGLRVHTLWA